jgi:hypothetical protein
MVQYSLEELRFLDEMSKDDRMLSRHFGQLRKGRSAKKKQAFVRGRCTLIEALLTLDGIVVGTVVKRLMMKTGFLEYLKFNVVSWFLIYS